MPIFKSKYPDVVIPNMTVPEFVFGAYQPKDNGRVAYMDGLNEDNKFTFGEVRALSHKIAKGLQHRGLRKGDVVASILINTIYYPSIFHGILLAGGVVTTASPAATSEELAKQFSDCKPKIVFTFSDILVKVEEAMKLAELGGPVISLGSREFSSLLDNDGVVSNVNLSANDLAALPYSSGTTGLPKGVMLSHRSMVASTLQIQALTALSINRNSVGCAFLPMFHIYGLVGFLIRSLYYRYTVVVYPRFDPQQMLEGIQKHRVTHLNIVPPIALLFAKHPMVDKYDLSSLKVVSCGAAPLSKEVINEVFQRTKITILQGFGMTETPSTTIITPAGSTCKAGSCGVLISNVQAKVISLEDGRELEENETGEVCLRCPNMMDGYLNRSDANIIDKDGFLHTGDIGYVDEDGDWFIIDRVKELIKYNAFQVAPAELEALILTHPKVQDVAVIGRPDVTSGELPAAFVVLKLNQTMPEKEIIEFVNSKVSTYKHIRGGVFFVEQIPKSPSGKILRRMLRARLIQPTAKL